MNDSNPFPVWSGQPKQGAAPASNHLDGTAVGMKEYCKTCKMPFKDYDALLEHKLSDPKHNMCYVCMAEFKTLAAKDNHQKQVCDIFPSICVCKMKNTDPIIVACSSTELEMPKVS